MRFMQCCAGLCSKCAESTQRAVSANLLGSRMMFSPECQCCWRTEHLPKMMLGHESRKTGCEADEVLC